MQWIFLNGYLIWVRGVRSLQNPVTSEYGMILNVGFVTLLPITKFLKLNVCYIFSKKYILTACFLG